MDLVTSAVFSPGGSPVTGPAVAPEQVVIARSLGLLAVADAPRGEDGRAAARLALELVRSHVERNDDLLERFRRNPTPELRLQVLTLVEECFARAAQEVFAFARRRPGVSVTLDVALLLEHEAFIGHVGDGRVYLVRRGLVHQLTIDHSRGDEAIQFDDPALLSSALEASVPGPTRTLGPAPHVRVETLSMELAPDDRLVVCSAAVHRSIPEHVLTIRLTTEALSSLPAALATDAPRVPLLAACAQLGGEAPFTGDSAAAELAILAPMPLFAHCTERELRIVAQSTHPRRFLPGSVIFEEGQPGTELYLLISGGIQVSRGGAAIAQLGPGSTFGEMAMLDEPYRSASAVTTEPTELMVISRQAFFGMLRGNPLLAVKILWNLLLGVSANLRRTNDRVAVLELAKDPDQSA